jgi:hypothetical protein
VGRARKGAAYDAGRKSASGKLSLRIVRIRKHGLGVFAPVLAKHSKSFFLIDCISVGVERMERNLEPMRKQVRFRQPMSRALRQMRQSEHRSRLRAFGKE